MRLPSQTSSGVAPLEATASTCCCDAVGDLAVLLMHVADDGVGGPLADLPAVGQIDAAHARLGREFDEPGAGGNGRFHRPTVARCRGSR